MVEWQNTLKQADNRIEFQKHMTCLKKRWKMITSIHIKYKCALFFLNKTQFKEFTLSTY